MDQVQIDKIKDLIEYERNRTSPPSTFPKLPDLPGKRYTDREFFELEKENLWKKTWLLAGHLDEIPETGCYKLWGLVYFNNHETGSEESSGSPICVNGE